MSKHQFKARIQTQKVIDSALENARLWTGNSKYYSEKAIFNLLLFSALENTSVEDSCDYLHKKYETAIPSQDTVMRVIDRFYGSMTTGEIENTIANNLQKEAKLFPHFKHRRSKVIIVIDLHDEEYFGKNIFDSIENTYRHARSVKIRTSTRKPHLRWVFWGISMLIELLWEIIRYSHGISKIPTYQSRQKMVNRQFHDFIMELLASARFRIN